MKCKVDSWPRSCFIDGNKLVALLDSTCTSAMPNPRLREVQVSNSNSRYNKKKTKNYSAAPVCPVVRLTGQTSPLFASLANNKPNNKQRTTTDNFQFSVLVANRHTATNSATDNDTRIGIEHPIHILCCFFERYAQNINAGDLSSTFPTGAPS